MGRPKRDFLATAEETLNPPATLDEGHALARVKKAEGNNLYSVELASNESLLVELPARFRSQIWIKRGGFVVIDTSAFNDRENKLGGEIVNVVVDNKEWQKRSYWYARPVITQQWLNSRYRPREFRKLSFPEDSGDEESTVGKMPPSEDSE